MSTGARTLWAALRHRVLPVTLYKRGRATVGGDPSNAVVTVRLDQGTLFAVMPWELHRSRAAAERARAVMALGGEDCGSAGVPLT